MVKLESRLLGDIHVVKINDDELRRFMTWSFENNVAVLEDPESMCKANGALIDLLLEALLHEFSNNHMVYFGTTVSGEILHAVSNVGDVEDCFRRAVTKYSKHLDLSAVKDKVALVAVELPKTSHFVLFTFDTSRKVCKIIDPAFSHSAFPRNYDRFSSYMAAWLDSKGSYSRNSLTKAKKWKYEVENLDSHQCDGVSCGYIVVLLVLQKFGRLELDYLYDGGLTTFSLRNKLWNALLEEHNITLYKKQQ